MYIRPLLPFGIAALSVAFLGIDWGATPEQIRRHMLARKGIVADDAISETTLGFAGGSYAGIENARYQFSFSAGRFTQAIVFFLHTDINDAETAYTRLRRYIEWRYGMLELEPSQSSEEIVSHHCTTVSGRIGMGLTRLDAGYLVTAVFNGASKHG